MKIKINNTTNKNTVINSAHLKTPLGDMLACASKEGICFLGFVGQKKLEKQLTSIQKKLKATIISGKNPHLSKVKSEIDEYFAGTRKNFSVQLDTVGTGFRKQVWRELQKIPYGTTISYKEQATKIGNPKAVRAVANGNGANNISLIIPCHRVIASDGGLAGFAGGVQKKKWLIDFEKTNIKQKQIIN